jgi:site-specific DNA-methyltransferase (adenine-specific)
MAGYMPKAKTVEWETPQGFFDKLNKEFHFGLDPCATKENAKCLKYFTKADDGLTESWANCPVYVNPPYGTELRAWVRKAWQESQTSPYPIVVLVPVRSDTAWWHSYAMRADEIRFVKGRLKFGDGKQSSTFPSALLIFRCALDSSNQHGPNVSSY